MKVLNTYDPLNRNCKLNTKLVSRWQALPKPKGIVVRDLCRRHDASHNSLTASDGSKWTTNNPWGFGSIWQAGAAGTSAISAGSSWMPSGDITQTATFLFLNSAEPKNIIFSCRTSDGDACDIGGYPGFNRELYGGNYTNRALTGANSIADNTWYRVVLVSVNGGSTQFYLNGKAVGSTGTMAFATRTPTVCLGHFDASIDGTYQLGGFFDDVRVINRAWTAADAAADWKDVKSGYRDSLNWINLQDWPETNPAAATFAGPPNWGKQLSQMTHLRM